MRGKIKIRSFLCLKTFLSFVSLVNFQETVRLKSSKIRKYSKYQHDTKDRFFLQTWKIYCSFSGCNFSIFLGDRQQPGPPVNKAGAWGSAAASHSGEAHRPVGGEAQTRGRRKQSEAGPPCRSQRRQGKNSPSYYICLLIFIFIYTCVCVYVDMHLCLYVYTSIYIYLSNLI